MKRTLFIGLLVIGAMRGQSLQNQTFQQPATAAVPNPGAANGQTGNQKLAQTVNIQDFELPDSSKSCSGSSHDDGPAFKRSVSYLSGNGGGTLMMNPGSTCYIKTFSTQVVGVLIPFSPNGLKISGNNSTL